jgi:hypothetical protein
MLQEGSSIKESYGASTYFIHIFGGFPELAEVVSDVSVRHVLDNKQERLFGNTETEKLNNVVVVAKLRWLEILYSDGIF